jgi:hypothetical protein
MKETARIGSFVLISFLIAAASLTADISDDRPISRASSSITQLQRNMLPDMIPNPSPAGNYDCRLRVYVVEPESRWTDNTGFYHYDYGFLGFGLDSLLSVPYQQPTEVTGTWDVSQSSFVSDIASDNIMVIAVLFNAQDDGTGISDPYYDDPYGSPFTIYPVDAAAGATPGNPGADVAVGGSTHTVFIEESTSQSCTNCPYTRAALSSIHASGQYNFLYAAMITNQGAQNFLDENYNLYWVPTCYFDGGEDVLVGGYQQLEYYTDRITSCGEREVPDVDLTVSMSYVGDFEISFTVTVTNNVYSNSAPAAPDAPIGPSSGLLEDEHAFSADAVDPDGDQLYYMWDWGDMQSGWLGPFNSGELVNGHHTYAAEGEYNVSVKVKDELDQESGWSDVSGIKIVARGNANGDSLINIGDVVLLINYIFREGAPPDPVTAGDANCDGFTNVSDAAYLIAFIFREGPPAGCP